MTRVTYIDYKKGRRNPVNTAQWAVGGAGKMTRTSTGMNLRTWFGLSFSYGNWDWDAQLRIPNCYKRILVIGVCSKWDGNRGNDHNTPRGRRALLDFDSGKDKKFIIF